MYTAKHDEVVCQRLAYLYLMIYHIFELPNKQVVTGSTILLSPHYVVTIIATFILFSNILYVMLRNGIKCRQVTYINITSKQLISNQYQNIVPIDMESLTDALKILQFDTTVQRLYSQNQNFKAGEMLQHNNGFYQHSIWFNCVTP